MAVSCNLRDTLFRVVYYIGEIKGVGYDAISVNSNIVRKAKSFIF